MCTLAVRPIPGELGGQTLRGRDVSSPDRRPSRAWQIAGRIERRLPARLLPMCGGRRKVAGEERSKSLGAFVVRHLLDVDFLDEDPGVFGKQLLDGLAPQEAHLIDATIERAPVARLELERQQLVTDGHGPVELTEVTGDLERIAGGGRQERAEPGPPCQGDGL